MNYLPQSVIIKAERGQDIFSLGRQFVHGKNDTLIELFEHKKKNGVVVGIFVDDIRELREMVRTSKKEVRTIAVIADAAKMTTGAQNALLKMLEEPRDNLHILLVTATPEQLNATILSRCQQIELAQPKVGKVPEDKKAKAIFMAAGNHSELQKLISDDTYFREQVRLFEVAKQFVAAKKYERIKLVSKVKESRSDALELIRAALIVCDFMLRSRPSKTFHNQAKLLLEADKAIRKNGNIRLWLLKTVV